jgi:hemerythrin superfamily protein
MAKPRISARSRAASRKTGSRRDSTRNAPDAIALLKADHRQVEGWFGQFEKSRSDDRKQELATKICNALRVHTTIEEEIFYPAFLEATEEEDLHHEAEVEHDGAKKLIAEIEASGPGDEYYDAKVTVLSEMIKHHVKEEEQRDGMFAKARQSEMDLQALGERLQARKDELMADASRPQMRKGMAAALHIT